ncbi:M15 family metallopeptidase [Chitinimonas taiwanensis]|uniref:Peptidoglycan L-alanyl-D-glutamate endopeptidase CwlK n=1 Tax=Chitinimonas taiwanensis DSM 18899 TaxID=1121279 RepID=A0A1K2HDX3_9NEIS|nr:M15 family metallopeptidase [Chitinimonas taiwanensis]SFZ74967.1 peptidoglycan L-alanyl-D-glutamate endopeptidase CwlK [Chitinimonas taiwanensis DSM 18899]
MYENYLIICLVILILLSVLAAGLLVLSPELRGRFGAGVQQLLRGMQQGGAGFLRRIGLLQTAVGQGGRGWWAMQREAMGRNRWLLLATLCVLMTPLLLVFALRGEIDAGGGFDDLPAEQNAVIAQLLQGEQLVPPPPLPPEAFLTQEVELIRPMLMSASRDWMQLDEDFRQRLLIVFRLMEERHGYKMALLEGYRSPSRQNTLAGMGSHVSNARAFQSYHQYGLAADCAFLRNGKVVISERDPWAMRGYQLYGEVAESMGLVWGGRWKMMDFGHIELRRRGVLGSQPSAATAAGTSSE